MSRILTAAALALAALMLVPATSQAGGWATVGLSSMPDDARAGEVWVVDLTVLQHGVRPLEDVEPRVMIASAGGATGIPHAFDARPTSRAGVYRARVTFPSRGDWGVSVHDGFTGVHEFGVVRIGDGDVTAAGAAQSRRAGFDEPASGAAGSGVPLVAAIGVALLAGLLAALTVAHGRRTGRAQASGGPSPAGG
jgi:hypothetical protein